MRNKNVLFVPFMIFVLAFSHTSFGQLGFRTGIKIGYDWATLTDVDLDDIESLKAFTLGFSLEMRILNLAIQGDILYAPRGVNAVNADDEVETKLNYLSIPIVLKKRFFPLGVHPFVLAGPEFGFLLSASTDEGDEDLFKSQDFGFVVGGGLEFSFFGKSAYIEGRYYFGLTEISTDPIFNSSKNKATQVFVGILF